MGERAVYVNVSSEGARINPQVFESAEQAQMTFLSWRTNDTIIHSRVKGIEKIKYYLNTSSGQNWHEEEALVIEFGPLEGHIPLSESGFRTLRQAERSIGNYVAAIPDRFNPDSQGEALLLFSRERAIELMRRVNSEKLAIGINWTAVITLPTRYGYMVDISGYRAWLPLSLVNHEVSKPFELAVGEMIETKIMELTENKRLIVSRRDATPPPFELYAKRYTAGGRYLAELKTLNGRIGYATLPDGVPVRVQRGAQRNILKQGASILIRVTGTNKYEKALEGTIERILSI